MSTRILERYFYRHWINKKKKKNRKIKNEALKLPNHENLPEKIRVCTAVMITWQHASGNTLSTLAVLHKPPLCRLKWLKNERMAAVIAIETSELQQVYVGTHPLLWL